MVKTLDGHFNLFFNYRYLNMRGKGDMSWEGNLLCIVD
jgi:hypothetical protein